MDYAQLLATVIGSGIGTALVGAFLKYSLDRKLELQRAYLSRSTKVHERQVETLCKLHGYFTEIRSFLQLTQKSYVVEGEKTEEYPKRLFEAMNHARDTLTFGRLLIPDSCCDSV